MTERHIDNERMVIMKRREWLVKLRSEKGLTQNQVAEMAEVDRSTYAKAENGRSISVKTAKKIANALGFDWAYFFEDGCDEKGQKGA